MSKRRFYQPSLRELTVTELAMLLHKSHNVARKEQRQFLAQLGGEGAPRELDYFVSIAHNNADAVREAARLDQDLDQTAHVGHVRVTASVCQAVNWFTHAAISGSFGPDDSQYARSDIFLKEPSVIARAVEIFFGESPRRRIWSCRQS